MRVVLYDVHWQVLRMSSLERHHDMGGWATVEGTRDNLNRFEQYVYDTPLAEEHAVRQFRINNCLAAVAMGYSGQGRWDTESREMVQKFRAQHTTGYNVAMVQAAALRWDWRRVVLDLISLRNRDEGMYVALYQNLTRRTQRKANDTSRMELEQFLLLMSKFLWQTTA